VHGINDRQTELRKKIAQTQMHLWASSTELRYSNDDKPGGQPHFTDAGSPSGYFLT